MAAPRPSTCDDSPLLDECPLRELFLGLSAAAAPFVPHDEASLVVLDGPEDPGRSLAEAIEVVADANGRGSQFRAWLKTPLRIDNEVVGSVAWLSRSTTGYSTSDLGLLQGVADHVALALRARREAIDAAQERERTARVDTSAELLRELGGVLDIRSVFGRVSAIVQRVVPHDLLTMTFHEPDGRVTRQATSDAHAPTFQVQVGPDVLARPFVLLPELSTAYLESVGHAGPEARTLLSNSGFGSFLAVNVCAREQHLGIEFWSRRPHAFRLDDVPLARRIAELVALAVSHEQLADAARQVSEARARTRVLEVQVQRLTTELRAKNAPLPVGVSPAWRAVLRAAVQVAGTDVTVLLAGESGTGKEVLARLIHSSSQRHGAPFVPVNCAALPESLLESELFGYERGAFTGAQHSKPGQIEAAEGGLLFLDEVSEMSLSAQAKFLRFLQEREFQPLGGTRQRRANVRVVAATNVDLRKAIEQGTFRRDLYHRLRVFDVTLPPLRDRPEDIGPLTQAFLRELGERYGWPTPVLTEGAQRALRTHRWPGNVRELRNALERGAILSNGGPLEAEHLSLDAEDQPPEGATVELSRLERATIERVLRETRGNKSEAAKRLGVTRMQLYGRLRRHQLS